MTPKELEAKWLQVKQYHHENEFKEVGIIGTKETEQPSEDKEEEDKGGPFADQNSYHEL